MDQCHEVRALGKTLMTAVLSSGGAPAPGQLWMLLPAVRNSGAQDPINELLQSGLGNVKTHTLYPTCVQCCDCYLYSFADGKKHQ